MGTIWIVRCHQCRYFRRANKCRSLASTYGTSEQSTAKFSSLATGVIIPSPAKLSFCKGCVEGKLQRKPVKHQQSKRKLELIHSDVGMWSHASRLDRWELIDYSHYCYVYFLKQKLEIAEKLKPWKWSKHIVHWFLVFLTQVSGAVDQHSSKCCSHLSMIDWVGFVGSECVMS